MVDRSKIEKDAKKAFEVADFSHSLTYRAMSVAAKRMIKYAYKASEHQGRFGRDFKWQKTKRLAKHVADLNNAMDKIVSDLIDQIESIAVKTAKENIGEIPEDKWDKEAYLASLLLGDTFKSRMRRHTDKFKQEILDYVRVGQENKLPADKVFEIYMENIKEPQKHDMIVEAIMSGYVTMAGMSAYRSHANLNDDMLVRGFHNMNRYYWGKAEAKYIVTVKDSHTCDICVDLDGKVFPIEQDVLPVHLRCRCFEVPLLKRKDFEKV